jgi:NAD(P)H-hydrate epimerase
MRVLTTAEMQQVDHRAISELGIPSLVLMENAALGVMDALAEFFPEVTHVTILCGPGNNGGDGLALARHLEARGYRFRSFLITGRSKPRGDAAVQLGILEKAGIPVVSVGPSGEIRTVLEACARTDLVVDALFGTGLGRPLEGHFATLVEGLNSLDVPILAVDIPSGLEGSRGTPPGVYLQADLTVAFAAPKVAHVLPPAEEAAGRLVVADLGIPPWLVEEAPGNLHLSTAQELAACLLPRRAGSHKGSYGHALLMAGASGKAGAAILAARAAVRGGAGLVTAAVPQSILAVVDGGSVESMTLALPEHEDGLEASATGVVLAAAEGKKAVAIGPGLGLAPGTLSVVRRVVLELELPLVLDADGLNAFAGRLGALSDRQAPTVLTPHPGEMARLLGCTSDEVQADRLASARAASAESGAVVVLKGYRSLVAEPGGEVFINPTGNAGMATGGSGDVLTGLLVALLARGYEPQIATLLGVYLHGLAGDLSLDEQGAESLAAGDLLKTLPRAFAQLGGA